jgi:peptidoglycan/xylan/chitin deacetylase (PgdA/CDA1 family)
MKNYHIIGMQELEGYYYEKKNLKNSCHISFDDGDISFFNNVLPIVKKHKIPVSTYVSPLMARDQKNFWFQEISGYNEEKLHEIAKKVTNIGTKNIQFFEIKKFLKTLELEVIWEIIKTYQKETNTPPKLPMNMTAKQLIEVKSSGLVDIGAHTLNHPLLTNEKNDIAKSEIEGSIDQLSEILKCETKYFVYPNGDFGDREINILKQKGIKLAFTTRRDKISRTNNPLSIPRSGSPFISSLKNYDAYIFSKCMVQLLAGEKRYYKYANVWSSVTGNILK